LLQTPGFLVWQAPRLFGVASQDCCKYVAGAVRTTA
jgi:hypothetical protein